MSLRSWRWPLCLLGVLLAEAGCLAAAEAAIVVKVLGAGEPLARAYVALVAEDEPWSRPLEEQLVESSEVRWEVPPGRYRLVVGAPDHWWERKPVFELRAQAQPHLEVVNLRRLSRIEGRVLTTEGAPIAGAKVGHLRAFVADPNRLSELGENFLRDNWEVASQADGRFALPAADGHRHSVLIEASGYEPGLIDNEMLEPGESKVYERRLAKGASLKVTWSASSATGLLQLKPRDRTFIKKVPMVYPEWIWERAVEGGMAAWPSLPAGGYDLYWVGLSPKADTPAERLGSFELQAGDVREHAVELPLAVPAAGQELSDQSLGLPLILKLDGELPERFEGLAARVLTPAGWRPIPGTLEIASGGPFFKLAAGYVPGSRIVVEAEGLIGASQELGPEPGAKVPVKLWTRAELGGKLEAPPGEKIPKRGLLRTLDCPPAGEAHQERLAIPVEIAADGTLRTPVPAGCGCLVFEPGEFSSLAWHKLGLKSAVLTDAGTRKLFHGGSLLVRLADSSGQPLGGAQVDVFSPAEAEALARSALREDHSATLEQAKTSAEGWAELRNLPPGNYRLRAVAQGSGAPAFSETISLAANQQEIIDPWTVPTPGSLTLQLDGKNVSREEVEVVLEAMTGEPSLRFKQRPAADGLFRFREVPPGRWRVRVFYRPEGNRNEVATKELEMRPGEARREKLTIGATRYRAQLATLEGPLQEPGQIELFSQKEESTPTTAKIGERGTFEVHLPAPGKFSARLLLPELKLRLAISEVAFEDPERVTEVLLPGAKIKGVVVAGDGEPLARVAVVAQRFERAPGRRPLLLSQSGMTNELGEFALEFLEEGPWTLTAQSAEGKSRSLELVLAGDELKSGVLLQLEPLQEVRGRVVAASGQPVPGARILASFEVEGKLETQESRTTSEGAFTFRLPARAEAAGTFVVQPPSGALVMQRQVGRDVLLLVKNEYGELRLPLGEQPEGWSLEAEDGAKMSWGWLTADARDRSSLRVAPGTWTVRRQGEIAGRVYKLEMGDSVRIAQ